MDVHAPAGPLRLTLSLPGRAHLMNVLAAMAVAQEYGVDDRARLKRRWRPRGRWRVADPFDLRPAA